MNDFQLAICEFTIVLKLNSSFHVLQVWALTLTSKRKLALLIVATNIATIDKYTLIDENTMIAH